MIESMLTTVDNPHDPFGDYDRAEVCNDVFPGQAQLSSSDRLLPSRNPNSLPVGRVKQTSTGYCTKHRESAFRHLDSC